jgi:hypothetical protein
MRLNVGQALQRLRAAQPIGSAGAVVKHPLAVIDGVEQDATTRQRRSMYGS